MKKKLFVIGAVILSIFIIFITTKKKPINNTQFFEVKKGDFESVILTTGELQSRNYSEITAPDILKSRNLRISSIAIIDLVPEGTEVKKGDYVGELNKTDISNTLKTETESLETYSSVK